MPHIINDEEYRLFQEYKKTGLTPEGINRLIIEDLEEAPLPLIRDDTPTVDDFWDEK